MKRIYHILICLFLLSFSVLPVKAKDNTINTMSIDCTIDSSGSAVIVETWDMDVYNGTEGYKVFNNMHDMELELVEVEDDSGTVYEYINDWDVDLSREDKTNKCGLIVKNDGYELCFGVGNYGHRLYKMTYKIHHFINQYDDYQGINYAFISHMDIDVNKVVVEVHAEDFLISNEQTNIWSFGYNGSCVFDELGIHMETTSSDMNKVQLLAQFTSLLAPFSEPNNYYKDLLFDDILDDAKNGSDYDNDSSSIFSTILFGLRIVALLLIPIFLFMIIRWRRKKEENQLRFEDERPFSKKNVPMFHEIPVDNLFYAYYLMENAGLLTDSGKSNLMSAFLLKWIKDDYISFVLGDKEGFLFKHDTYKIDFTKSLETTSPLEDKLYRIFQKASGSNLILETKEFEEYMKEYPEKLKNFYNSIDTKVERELKNLKYFRRETTYRKFFGLDFPQSKRIASVNVRQDMEKLYGLYLFLKDQDNMSDKQVIEVELWEDYLIYAALFGIADKVESQIELLCPEFVEYSPLTDFQTIEVTQSFTRSAYHSSMMRSTLNEGADAIRNSGGGGDSSFGGGGSSFSGGGGGGVR